MSDLSYKMPIKEKKRGGEAVLGWKLSTYVVLDAFHSSSTRLNSPLKCWFHSGGGLCDLGFLRVSFFVFLVYLYFFLFPIVLFWDTLYMQKSVWVSIGVFFLRNFKVFLQTSSEWDFISRLINPTETFDDRTIKIFPHFNARFRETVVEESVTLVTAKGTQRETAQLNNQYLKIKTELEKRQLSQSHALCSFRFSNKAAPIWAKKGMLEHSNLTKLTFKNKFLKIANGKDNIY